MAVHHTKDKGDLGTAKAHADLVAHGFMVLFPATEHAEFDLVAYRSSTFVRVQVKYRSARSGAVTVRFRSVWAPAIQRGISTPSAIIVAPRHVLGLGFGCGRGRRSAVFLSIVQYA